MPSGPPRAKLIGIEYPRSFSACWRIRTAGPVSPRVMTGAFLAAPWSRALDANRGEVSAMTQVPVLLLADRTIDSCGAKGVGETASGSGLASDTRDSFPALPSEAAQKRGHS